MPTNDSLPDSAPGFDQPIAVLKRCHGRIRQQLATLERLLAHLPEHGGDDAARRAATAVITFFERAAHLHHEDEEHDLIPRLHSVATGADAATLAALAPAIIQDHHAMDALWQDLHEQLKAIADGSASRLSAPATEHFVTRYRAHMEREESTLAPMALRLFTPQQMLSMGASMASRRGIDLATLPELGQVAAKPIGNTVADLRTDYGQASLSEDEVLDDPLQQFARWFEQALAAQVNEPNAMNLATVDAAGRPSSRIVLVKQFDERGFTWYTNYESRKGCDLDTNPHAALLFFWSELERQVRIEGSVERTSAADSDKYFHSRPLRSRLSAIASHQSAPIANRTSLEQNYETIAATAGEAPARPANWGGFRLVPERIEFWQGRRSRFHDRIVYLRGEDGIWTRLRLQP